MSNLKRILGIILFISMMTTVMAAPVANVLKVKNDVQIKKEIDFDFQSGVAVGTAIDVYDEIKTGPESYAAIIFLDDKSIVKIRENSQIEFTETGNIRTIKMNEGKVLFDVNPKKIKEFNVQTPVSVASVKGTEFWVLVDESGEKIMTKEGTVNVFNPTSNQSFDVTSGNMCVIQPSGNMFVQAFTAADLPDESMFGDTEQAPTEEEPEAEEEGTVEEEETVTEEDVTTEEDTSSETEDAVEAPTTEPVDVEIPEEAPVEEDAAEDKPEKGGNENFGMGLGIGSATIDGVLYNQIAARPTFKIGKLGVGLDIVLFIDNEGNIRKDDWNTFEGYLDKIFFLSWGAKGDKFYARVGGLESVTIGNGIAVSGYTNMLEYPDVKRMGTDFSMKFGKIDVEGFVADWKEMGGESASPGLLGVRTSFNGKFVLPFTAGITFVSDMNPFNAFDKDRDGDGYSDFMDIYPDDEDAYLDNLDMDLDGLVDPIPGVSDDILEAIVRSNDNYTGLDNEVDTLYIPSIVDLMEEAPSVYSLAADFTVPVFKNKVLGLSIYTEGAILGYSSGSTSITNFGAAPLGISANMFKFINLKVEYRMAQENFVYGFFDTNYDFNRVYVVKDSLNNRLVGKTKMDAIMGSNIPAVKGIYGALSLNILKIATANVAYMNMSSGGDQLQTFQAVGSIQKGLIPKLSMANIYYQRNNDENPFDFANPSANTIMGYKVGMEVSEGVDIIWNYMVTYRDDNGDGVIDPELESIKIMSIETGFSF